MIVPPPGSTLFPYTTLFRSALPDGWAMGQGLARPRTIGFKTGTSYGFRDAWSVGFSNDYTVAVWVGRADGTPRDRKSTRLNSSHMSISYAVFCLKTKNTCSS